MTPCRHCQARPGTRARQLCSSCYLQLDVREKYPSLSKYGKRYAGGRQVADSRGYCEPVGGYHGPAEPTDAQPGSEAKILVMAARFEAGERLHHAADNRRCVYSRRGRGRPVGARKGA